MEIQSILNSDYNANVYFSDSLQDKKISVSFDNVSLKNVLDSICWQLDCSYNCKEGKYFVGGKKTVFKVYDNPFYDKTIESAFPSKVRLVQDKIVVECAENEISVIESALLEATSRESKKVHINVTEFKKSELLELGIDIDKGLMYGVSWENLIKNPEPIQLLTMSAYASLKANESNKYYENIINTDMSLVLGVSSSLSIAKQIDRTLYQVSDYGTRTIGGYSTARAGIIINLQLYKFKKAYILQYSIEDSEFTSETGNDKKEIKSESKIILSDTPSAVIRYERKTSIKDTKKGVPFLCDIPYLGRWLFGVNSDSDETYIIVHTVNLVE